MTDFNIEKAPLSKALAYLDALVEPHGLQILYKPVEGRAEPTVNLKTRSLTLSRNLGFLAAQGAYDWWVDNGVIIVGLPEAGEALVTEFIPIHNSTARRFVENQRAK